MTRKKRLLVFLIFVGVFLASYSIGAETQVSDEEATAFLKEFNQSLEGIDAIAIFIHNASIALPMFIPGFGVAWGAFAAWTTGVAFSSLVKSTPALSQLPPLSVLLISPFGLMELVAYSIGTSRSFLLIRTILKKNPLRPQVRSIAIEVGIAMMLLLAGGVLEFVMIQQFGSDLNFPQS